MSTNPTEPRRQYPSTYFADRANLDEMARLAVQDQLMTTGMGGVLPEQPNADSFQRVLDVGCGTGGWLIETAKTYPNMARLVGVDVNSRVIEYAREQAKVAQVQDRVEFQVMDALLILEFPKGYFDLTNMRLATGFMRTWNWPKLLDEMQRITRSRGIIRFTEIEGMDANSPALMRLSALAGDAFYKAGHLFSEGQTEETFTRGTAGVANDLVRLMEQYGVQNVQTRSSIREFLAGTADVQGYAEDMRLGFRTMIPFIRKWSRLPDNYEELYQEMLRDMQQPDFTATWRLLTAWGTRPPL
ncbi:MAG TPA: class I SAM-dependent methyltransferase [Ktedonobacteraceae bacterium]|nr:class I SAM-dependent methyltransferase [Ktedonobacteraceae bacterium]